MNTVTRVLLYGGLLVGLCACRLVPMAPADKTGSATPTGGALNLKEYRTVATAITAVQSPASATVTVNQSGYLGVEVESLRNGSLRVTMVEPASPAAVGGIQAGDLLLALNGEALKTREGLHEQLQSLETGKPVRLRLARASAQLEVPVTPGLLSQPLKVAGERGLLGLSVGEPTDGAGLPITRVTTGLPADKAGIRHGDVLLKIGDTPLFTPSDLTVLLTEHSPGETVTVTYRSKEKVAKQALTLVPDPNAEDTSYIRSTHNLWKQPVFRVAVVPVEYLDVKHNPRIITNEWAQAFFSRGVYHDKTNATGQTVYGSLADYYAEQSGGTLRVSGSVFDWVELPKKRADYAPSGSNVSHSVFFTNALNLLMARVGRETLTNFDGFVFVFAGDRFPGASRNSLYWPHKSNLNWQGRRWPIVICPEGGARMNNISVFCHEFGHVLGLPDLYARPENPGSEGLGRWCAMSHQSPGGQPQHFSAWCKEQLGWLKPAVLDPTVKQKLLLGPVEGSTRECYKILVRRDGSEYFLLENRRKTGFDQSLPAEGLLIWRVVRNHPILEESHGVEGPLGPRVYLRSVPYPSEANHAFTPFTIPSSRSLLGGGLPVHLTGIRRLSDGRIAFQIGYEYE
ncbi:MAG: M6 family metalloprotease domain-containing protein [Verrucomicrobiota bacterium]